MSKWRFLLSQVSGRLWVRASLYGFMGVAAALLAALLSPLVPDALAKPFGGGTVTGLLNVLASSLLAVATFSVAAMLTAYTNVSQSATPRTAALIAGNRQAQGALATFVGGFLYSVVGYSAIGTGYYRGGGRAILFGVTIVMLVIIAITLLRWLDQLLSLARVGNALSEVERATFEAMEGVFGAARADLAQPMAPAGCTQIKAERVGFVQNVDVEALQKIAVHHDLQVWIDAPPGAFATPQHTLAHIKGAVSPRLEAKVRGAFSLGQERSFTQDPRFGFLVLSEVGSHALSPAINNTGVALDVIASAVRLLSRWMELQDRELGAKQDRVFWRRPTFGDVLEDALLSISIDGAASLPVALRLQSVLAAIGEAASDTDRDALRHMSREALERSEAKLDYPPDLKRVRSTAQLTQTQTSARSREQAAE